MRRWGIYFDEGDQQFYLGESVHNRGVFHNRGILLSEQRKAEYDAIMQAYTAWQKFLERKYHGFPARIK